jgi:hypothetical protein
MYGRGVQRNEWLKMRDSFRIISRDASILGGVHHASFNKNKLSKKE